MTNNFYKTRMPIEIKVGLLIFEALLLLVDTLGFSLLLIAFVTGGSQESPTSVASILETVAIPLGVIGLPALWLGYFSVLVLARNVNGRFLRWLYLAFLCGAISDIGLLYALVAQWGYAYADLSGSLLLITLYGGPMAICGHIFLARRELSLPAPTLL